MAVTGCEAVDGLTGGSQTNNGGSILQAAPQTPADVVSAFLDAWNTKDYQRMYTLLSSESQGRTPFPVFQTTYENVATELNLSGVTFNVGDVREQGAAAAVSYELTIGSPGLGEITDAGRTMRLVSGPAGWRVAWTTMDIFDGLAPGALVDIQRSEAPRGNIYDRAGLPLVEQDGTLLEIYVQRQNMSDEAVCYGVLGTSLRVPYADIAERAAANNFDTIFYVGDIDPEEFAYRSTDLSEYCGSSRENGLIQERTDRRYVGHGAAAHITGYVGQATEEDIAAGYDLGMLVGQAGIEQAFDAELRGEAAQVLQITEPGGTVIRTLGNAEGAAPQSVTLTIDRDLQIATAQALYDAYAYAQPSWGSRSPGAAAVVVDIDTGAILALGSYPTFDPGLFSPNTSFPFPGAYILELLSDPQGAFFNRPIQGQYAPGSVFKIITTAAVANEELMEPDETFYCGLRWENGPALGDTQAVRLDWRASESNPDDVFPTGDVTMAGALTSSCDPFFYEMGARLFQRSPGMIPQYAQRLGLGQAYGLVGLGVEAPGEVPVPNDAADAINEAIGQGDVQIPPLQMAMAVAAVANGGTVYQPYIVQRVGPEGGPATFEAQPTVLRQSELSQEALDVVREGMCDVTTLEARNTTNGNPLGTAWFVFQPDNGFTSYYSICAKTGTAQTESDPNAWFVAYVPADNPQIAIAVMSQNSREGSEVAAPIMRRLLDDYLNVPPEYFAPFPEWWTQPFNPMSIAEGGTGGG